MDSAHATHSSESDVPALIRQATKACDIAREAFRIHRAQDDNVTVYWAKQLCRQLSSLSNELFELLTIPLTRSNRTPLRNGGISLRKMAPRDSLACAQGFDSMEWASLWLAFVKRDHEQGRRIDLFAEQLQDDVRTASAAMDRLALDFVR